MLRLTNASLLISALVLASPALSEPLPVAVAPGQPAPPLAVSRWIKDGPVDRFEPGRVYVVDLWATWCAPCIATMPHLTRLQARYASDVTVIGMNVWEMEPKRVPGFVASRADSMRFAVAMDSVPPGKEANEGLTAATYVGTSLTVSIPKTILIDREGRVAWIGTPHGLEEPLKQVVAGTWDVKPFAERYEAEQQLERKYLAQFNAVERAVEASQWERAFEAAEATVKVDPSFAERIASAGFGSLARAILRDSTASPSARALAQRSAERGIALQAAPHWAAFQLAARAARAAGDKAAARKHLASAIERAKGDDREKLRSELKALESGQ
jgi:thiol-disulfide isomerase/thioredoxin